MNYFELACALSRSEGRRLANLPALAPEEHAIIEQAVGRKLTNVEAQLALKDATIMAAFEHWLKTGKSGFAQ